MGSLRQCAKCGLVLPDICAQTCPMCGASIATPVEARIGAPVAAAAKRKLWLGGLVQAGLATTFMLLFGFPHIMIAVFVGIILLFNAVANQMKSRAASGMRGPQRPAKNPALVRLLEAGIALSAITMFGIGLFSAVIFSNSWMRWQQYQGRPYRRSEFRVVRVSFRRSSSRSVPISVANGLVDGEKEQMNLWPYLRSRPRDQAELEQLVPVGTSIPIYLFSDLKGRVRVQVNDGPPPAEASRAAMMSVLNHGGLGLAISGLTLFILIRLRRACFAEAETMQTMAATAGSGS